MDRVVPFPLAPWYLTSSGLRSCLCPGSLLPTSPPVFGPHPAPPPEFNVCHCVHSVSISSPPFTQGLVARQNPTCISLVGFFGSTSPSFVVPVWCFLFPTRVSCCKMSYFSRDLFGPLRVLNLAFSPFVTDSLIFCLFLLEQGFWCCDFFFFYMVPPVPRCFPNFCPFTSIFVTPVFRLRRPGFFQDRPPRLHFHCGGVTGYCACLFSPSILRCP